MEREREGYIYTSSGQGFDAYVNSGGRNQFVTISTIDPASVLRIYPSEGLAGILPYPSFTSTSRDVSGYLACNCAMASLTLAL